MKIDIQNPWIILAIIVLIILAIVWGGYTLGYIKLPGGVEIGLNPPPTPIQPVISVDKIAGNWTGTIKGISDDWSAEIVLSIQEGCTIGAVCGTYSVPSLPCSGNLILGRIDGDTFVFIEQRTGGEDWCASGGSEYLNLISDSTLSWAYSNPGEDIKTTGVLIHR